MADLLRCTAETSTMSWSNYPPINKNPSKQWWSMVFVYQALGWVLGTQRWSRQGPHPALGLFMGSGEMQALDGALLCAACFQGLCVHWLVSGLAKMLSRAPPGFQRQHRKFQARSHFLVQHYPVWTGYYWGRGWMSCSGSCLPFCPWCWSRR